MAVPIPFKATTCGLVGASSVKVKLPVRVPFAVGLKVTLTAQLAPTDTVAPQVFLEIAKSPLAVMLAIFSVAVPVLVRVTLFALLVTPMTVLGKLSEVGDSVTAGTPSSTEKLKTVP